jgi:transcriptional regulator with XRE-family HTH domain
MKPESAIERYRRAHGLTLEEFGKLFDPAVDKSTVSRWERGRLTPQRALMIERLTGIPRQELLPEVWPEEQAEATR